MSKEERAGLISTGDVERLMLSIRGKDVLLDRDVALLYGVETRIVNQAVRINPKKFPKDYIIELDEEESSALRSKILTLEQKGGKGRHSKYNIKAFTEKGLYMLATILKTPRAIGNYPAPWRRFRLLKTVVSSRRDFCRRPVRYWPTS